MLFSLLNLSSATNSCWRFYCGSPQTFGRESKPRVAFLPDFLHLSVQTLPSACSDPDVSQCFFLHQSKVFVEGVTAALTTSSFQSVCGFTDEQRNASGVHTMLAARVGLRGHRAWGPLSHSKRASAFRPKRQLLRLHFEGSKACPRSRVSGRVLYRVFKKSPHDELYSLFYLIIRALFRGDNLFRDKKLRAENLFEHPVQFYLISFRLY